MAVKKPVALKPDRTPVPYKLTKCAGCNGSFMRVELIPQQDGTLLCPKCACTHTGGTHEVVWNSFIFDADGVPHPLHSIHTHCNQCGKVLSKRDADAPAQTFNLEGEF